MKWGIMVMKSKTSLLNRGILLNDFKRFAWIGAGYLLILLLSVPLKVFMLYSKSEDMIINNTSAYLRIFQFDTNAALLQVMSLIIVPVLTGLLLFRYLQDSQASDMLHTLPVKRETLYNTHVMAGIIFLFVPLILTALVTWALVAGLGIEHVNSTDILSWLAVSLLMNLLFFICSVVVGMITGMSTVQGVLSFILLLLPSGLSMLLLYNMSKYIYGLPHDFYSDKITHLSPLIRLTENSIRSITTVEIVVYLSSSIALYFLGRRLYRKRRLEAAGDAITFDILRPVFKYGVTFCFMLLLGSYFYSDQGNMGWTYFGYFLGSLLAYFLAEILLNKSLQVFQLRRLKGYGIYCLVIIALLGLLHFDCAGYEKSLPDPVEVRSIYLDYSFYALKEKDNNIRTAVNVRDGVEYKYQPPVPAIFTEKDNIANIYALHQKIVANRLDGKEAYLAKRTNNDSQQICLAYELENGRHFYRQYEIAAQDYAAYLKPIYESREYKHLHNEILRINIADINLIEVSASGINKNVRIIEPGLIAQAVGVLQSDVYERSYEEMTDMRPPWAHINISLKDHRSVDLGWEKSYDNFGKWLIALGAYNQARLLPDDIAYAIVDKNPDLNRQDTYKLPSQLDLRDLEEKPGILKITDPEKLELCLRNLRNYGNYNRGNMEQSAYSVVFLLKNGATFSGLLFEDDAPAFVKEHFAG